MSHLHGLTGGVCGSGDLGIGERLRRELGNPLVLAVEFGYEHLQAKVRLELALGLALNPIALLALEGSRRGCQRGQKGASLPAGLLGSFGECLAS